MLRTVLSRKLVFLKRLFSSQTEGEKKISEILKQRFPTAEAVQVTDVSGGCGAMYEIQIVSDVFHGKRTVMQHRMVNEALKEEVKEMHGLRIITSTPEKDKPT